jgi:rhodanese-related sulfurtransferase
MHRLRPFVAACLLVLLVTGPAAADPTPEFIAMAEAGAAYVNDGDCPGLINAQMLLDNLDDYTVIDIRRDSHYQAGHIPGAYNSALNTLVDDLATSIPTGKPYVIACYTGITAGHAKIAMELLGYDEVSALLFGMSAWHVALDVWTSNCADQLADPETANQNGDLIVHDYPVIDGDVPDRVAAMLAAGFKGKGYADIQDNLDDYFVISYMDVADYEGTGDSGAPGHIPGAFQFTPRASLGLDQMLHHIPVDMPVVVYSWTGQTESQIAAYLNMLGYDAYALKFGANSLFYSDLTAHKWVPHDREFPLSTDDPTAAPTAPAALVTGLANHPNPFNPATTISYRLDRPARVTLRIYDVAGRLVRELVRGAEQAAGPQAVTWRGLDTTGQAAPSGVYLYRIEAAGQVVTGRMALLE